MRIFEKSEDKINKNLISETIFITVITAVSYLGVFVYKLGSFSFYNIDPLFIDINLRDVLSINALALIVLLEIMYYLSYLVINRKENQKRFRWLFPLLLIVIVAIPALIIFFAKFNFILAVILIIGAFFGAFLKYKTEKKNDPLDYLNDKFGILVVFSILIIILYCAYCYAIGLYNAKSKIDYPTLYLNQKSLVIISSYDDSFLCLPFNTESKKFYDALLLITQDDISEKELLIKKEKIGPLKLE
jgi:hypothetical protein